jgi:Tfp pilus assembly protein PilN
VILQMINLLPLEYKKNQRKALLFRVSFVALTIFSLVVAASSILLLPLYLSATAQVKGEKDRLNLYKTSQSFSDTETSSRTITDTNNKISIFALEESDSQFSAVLTLLDEITPSGISITDMTLATSDSGKKSTQLELRGNASTRESLVKFVDALKAQKSFESVELPISGLVKDSNIDFNMSFVINYEN